VVGDLEAEYKKAREPFAKELGRLADLKKDIKDTIKGRRQVRLIEDEMAKVARKLKRVPKPFPYEVTYFKEKLDKTDKKDIIEKVDRLIQKIAKTKIIEQSFVVDRNEKLVDTIYGWFPYQTWNKGFGADYGDCEFRPRISLWVDGARRTIYGGGYNSRSGTSIDDIVTALAGRILGATVERKWVFSSKDKRSAAKKRYKRIGGDDKRERKIVITVTMTYHNKIKTT
jgi:hypothetical protein